MPRRQGPSDGRPGRRQGPSARRPTPSIFSTAWEAWAAGPRRSTTGVGTTQRLGHRTRGSTAVYAAISALRYSGVGPRPRHATGSVGESRLRRVTCTAGRGEKEDRPSRTRQGREHYRAGALCKQPRGAARRSMALPPSQAPWYGAAQSWQAR